MTSGKTSLEMGGLYIIKDIRVMEDHSGEYKYMLGGLILKPPLPSQKKKKTNY